jgi:hypothetical protein
LASQPSNTVVYGNGTAIADLSPYRQQIIELLTRADSPWQNPANYYDVSRSGHVSPQDLLLIVNELLRSSAHDLVGAPGAGDFFYDVNGDRRVSQSDLIAIVNLLLAGGAPSAAPLAGAHLVPEPSTAALATVAVPVFVGVLIRRPGVTRRRLRPWP